MGFRFNIDVTFADAFFNYISLSSLVLKTEQRTSLKATVKILWFGCQQGLGNLLGVGVLYRFSDVTHPHFNVT